MDTHKNARLTPKGREEMVRAVVDGGLSQGRRRAPLQHDAEDSRPNGLSASAPKALMVCATDPQSLFHRQAKLRRPSCAGRRGFAPAALHRQADCGRVRRLGSHRQPHPAAARAQQASAHWSQPSQFAATSGSILANWSTSISRSSARSTELAIASPATAEDRASGAGAGKGLGWSSFTSASTTLRALPFDDIRRVLPVPLLAPPIGAPDFVEGFFDLQGRPVAAIRSERLLGLQEHNLGIYAPLILLKDEDPVALHVGKIDAIVKASGVQRIGPDQSFNGCVEGHLRRLVRRCAAGMHI